MVKLSAEKLGTMSEYNLSGITLGIKCIGVSLCVPLHPLLSDWLFSFFTSMRLASLITSTFIKK